ncbi:MAG: filamentous hemagglutinin N-terminal domain-containing protein [Cyanobacteria bacterium J06621_8]
MRQAIFTSLKISLWTFYYLFSTSSGALAQVTSDGTVNTQVNQNGNIAEITGGEVRGGNLFHSFQDFSVPTGNEAFFNNGNAIESIFSRVTGGRLSNIDGVIRANGSASLFLINPAGIIFGENASLSIGGSFYGSSASSILFEGGEFSAVDNLNQPILTVNAPIGLSFRDNPGDIINRSRGNNNRGLEVNPGNSLSLLGGNISFDGGIITAPGGTVELGGLSTAGTISISDDFKLSFPDGLERADLSLSNNAVIDITGNGGGRITINTNNLELTDESLFLAGIGEDLGAANSVAGTIDIEAESIIASNNSQIRSDNLGIGRGGTININTETLDFTGDSAIVVSSFGIGDGGIVNLNAQDISIDGEWSGIYSTLGLSRIATDEPVSDAIGNGGVINLDTNTLSLTNGTRISTNSAAQGNAGNINIKATGEVFFGGSGTTFVPAFKGKVIAGLLSQVQFDEGVGNGGQIVLEAGSLQLDTGGGILADNVDAKGDAGDIQIDVRDNIFVSGFFSLIQTRADNAGGDAGDINIRANSFESNSLRIITENGGIGNSGNITIDIAENFGFNSKSLIQASLSEGAVGNAGNVTINVGGSFISDQGNQNSLDNRNQILASSGGTGNAGDIQIIAGDSILLRDNFLIFADVSQQGIGNAGSVILNAGENFTLDSSQILSQIVDGGGNAEDISITANTINITNFSQISTNAQAEASGEAGNIELNGTNIFISGGALVDSFTENDFDGGNINLSGSNLIVASGGTIVTSAEGTGQAGNINLNFTENITIDGAGTNPRPDSVFPLTEPGLINLQSSTGLFANSGAESQGNGGNINLNIGENVNLLNNSTISAQAFGNADGGNIGIAADLIVAFPNGNNDILASAEQGQGGNISFAAQGVLGFQIGSQDSQTNDIDASGTTDGEVIFLLPNTNFIQGLLTIPNNIVFQGQTTQQACQANRETLAKGGLSILGRSGIVPDPGLPLNSLNITVSAEENPTSAIPQPIKTSQGEIQPARGIEVTESGKIILTAYRTNNSGDRIIETRNCT